MLLLYHTQAESLLREFEARVSLRTTPRKSNKKRFDFSVRKSPDEGARTVPVLPKQEQEGMKGREERGGGAPDTLPLTSKNSYSFMIRFSS